MRSWIIVSAVLITLAVLTPAFGDESATNPEDIVKSGWNETLQLMNEALPQMIFIVVLLLNLCASLIDPDRNFKASLISTIILVAITHWGGFYKPLFEFLNTKL
jgi:TRAP-type C4-dicarboxylate transport system permease large subunit